MVFNQRAYLYFPPREYPFTPSLARLRWEDLQLTAEDGVRIRAWWIPAARPDAPVLMYLHGNGANLSSFVDIAASCHREGLAFFAIDYRGYGASEGSPTEAGLYRDALAGFRWIEGRGAAARTVVYGQSLGSAVAAWLAGHAPVAGLVLEAALPSTYHMARLHYPWLLVPPFLIRDRYRTVEHLRQVTCPVLVIHGERDEIAPIRFGRMVFAAAHEPKQFLSVAGSGHNDLRWNDPMIQGTILTFIDQCAAGRVR
jgi:fermentation-respiration switch protein FrsA (DUF1100 family)